MSKKTKLTDEECIIILALLEGEILNNNIPQVQRDKITALYDKIELM